MTHAGAWTDVDEQGFQRLVGDAQGLADVSEKIVAGQQGDLLFEDATLYPGATLIHLERWAAIQFAGGLLMLTRPQVANASITLLRGVLEAYSHVWWIRQGTPTGADSQRCRALCYEHSIARELSDAVTNAPKEVTTPEAAPEAKRRVANLEKLMQSLGCECKGRDYTDVMPTFREIAKSENVTWLPEMVRATRMTSHQAQRDRIMRYADDGAIEVGGPATPFERSVLLEWLVTIFGRLGREVAMILEPKSEADLLSHLTQLKAKISFLRQYLSQSGPAAAP
ncbi:MAG: hypothetical protein QOH92_1996 [Chloroflexota bacterium]|jgi:hypothetical protein|nr:hypothetical protein [Chloroflexota bacterium]